MSKIYRAVRTTADLNKAIPEDLKKAAKEPGKWGKEHPFLQEYWPTRIRLFGRSDRGVPYTQGVRPGFIMDMRYGDGRILVPEEQELLYSPKDGSPALLVTTGDFRITDADNNTNTPRMIVSALDELMHGDHSEETGEKIQRMLYEVRGLAVQNTSWGRTMISLENAYKNALEGRVQAASERAISLTDTNLPPEELFDAFYNLYIKEGIDSFLTWSEAQGLDLETMKALFTNLPFSTESEVWGKLEVDERKVGVVLADSAAPLDFLLRRNN